MKHRVLIIVLILSLLPAHAQRIAVKTNGLMLAAWAPNVAGEIVVGERTTVALGAFMSKKVWGKDVKTMGLQPEVRYWFGGRPMVRHFVGLGALATHYELTWGDQRYKGDAYGAGLTFGYAWKITPHLGVEAYTGLGYVRYSHQQSYVTDNYQDYLESTQTQGGNNVNGYKLMPTNIGISIIYIIK